MSDERRYQEDEVARIFETAATRQHARGRTLAADGMTLSELQAIGGEVGIAPERIAEAAADLDQPQRSATRRTELGMPIGVGRTVELPRQPTEREWAVLLADLRTTFAASGRDVSQGDIRGWTNGNLHAFIEPTDTGWRLRMGTHKENAVATNRIAIGGFGVALILAFILLLAGEPVQDLVGPLMLLLFGAGGLTINALRVPPWAREREAQMEHIAERARALVGPAPAGAPALEPPAERD